jgi:hypothetical protein
LSIFLALALNDRVELLRLTDLAALDGVAFAATVSTASFTALLTERVLPVELFRERGAGVGVDGEEALVSEAAALLLRALPLAVAAALPVLFLRDRRGVA